MKQLFNRIAILIVAIAIAFVATSASAPQRWETVDSVSVELAEDKLDIAVQGQYIYVYSPKPVNVKLFTILGQLVSQETLPSGTSRLKVNARGIYILKAGTTTRRITI